MQTGIRVFREAIKVIFSSIRRDMTRKLFSLSLCSKMDFRDECRISIATVNNRDFILLFYYITILFYQVIPPEKPEKFFVLILD